MNFGNVGANEEQVVYNEEMSENCMMELEISMFPHFKTPENIMDYLYIRNTIVKMWQNEPHKEVTVDQIHRNLRHRELECKDICKVFEFLVRYGYINVGLYKFSKEPLLKTGKKVIIIGAGLSGICAARQLLKMGIDVIILEASDRVGGRIQTISYPRLDYGRDFADIGASVIRCSKNNPMSTLLQQLNCTRSAIPEEFPVYDQVGKQLIAHRTAVMKDMFNHLIQLVAHVNSNGPVLDGEGRELDLERSLLYMTQVLNIDKRETRKSLQSMRNKLSEIMVLHKELSLNKRIHRPSFGSEINTESIQIGGVTHIEKEAAMLVQGFVSKVHKMSSDQIKSDRVKKDGYSHRLVREKVYEDMKMMDFNKAVYEGQHGAPLSFLSSKHCKVREDTKHIRNRMQITEGLGYLIRTLATPIKNKIILGCRVAEIDYTDKDLVRVKCLRGESKETFHLSESHVLVTVPLGVLKDTAENKEDCIKFNPPLPDVKIAAIKEMGWGHVNKIAMWFESLFWKPKNLCFGYLNENPANRGKMFYFTTSPGSHTLTAEMSGLSAIYNRTDEEIVKECVCVLKKIFGEHKVPMPKRYVVSRWHEQPNIKGAMSFLHPGSNPEICDVISCNLMCAVSTDGSSCKPKVFFAGEHTCRNHIGTLEGAWHSGVREAAKIAAAILGSPFDSSENCRGTLNQYEDVFAFKQSHTFMKKFESLAERLDKAYSEAEQARKYDPTPACHGSDAVKSSSSSAVNKTSGSNMKFASTIGIKRNVGVKKQTPPKVGLLNPQSRGPYLTIPKPEILYQPSSLVQGKVCTFLSTVGSEGTTHHKPMQSGAKHQIAFSQRPSCIRDIVQPAVLMSNLIPTLAKEAETKIVVVEERSRAFKVPKVELAPSIASRNKLVAKKNNRSVSSSHENSTIEFSPAKAKCKKRIDHDYIKKKESKTSFSSSISGSDLKRTHSDTAQTSSKTLIVKIKRFKPTDSSDTSQPFATLVSSVSKDDLRPTEIISAINVPLSPAQPMSTPVLPVSIAAQPMSISFQSVSIPVQPVFTSVQPVSNPVQPGSISVQPMSIPFQPMPFLAQPVSIPVQPVSTSVEPVSNPVQPGSISVQPMSIPFQPMPFVAQPVSIPEQPMSFLAQPVPISFQSVSIPVQPVSTSVQPVSNLVQPGSISVQPMSIPFQPMPFLVQPVSIPPHSTQYPQISEELWNFMRKFALERMAKYLYMERAFLDAAYIITYTVTHAKSVAFPDDHSSTGIPFLLVTLIGGEYMCRAVNLASEVFNEKLDSVIESVMRTEPNDFVQAHAISTKLNEEYMTRIQELASSLTDEYISRAQIVASQVIARSMEDEIIDVVGLDETDNPAFELVTPDVSIVQDLTSTQTLKNGELGNKETTQRDTVDLNDSKEDGIKVEKKKVNTALSDEDLYLDWSGSQIMKPRKCARESAAKIKKIQCAHKKERAPRKVKVDKKPRQAKKTLEKRSKTEKNPPVFRVKRKYVRKTIKNISNQRISELEGISDNLMADNQIENHDDEQPCVVTDADNKDENDELIPSDYTGDAFHHGSAVFNGDIHDHIEEYDRQVLEPNGCQPIFFAPIIAPERLNETISNDENMLVDVSNYEEVITTLPEPVFYDRFGNAFVNDENYVYTNPEDVIEIFEEDLELFDRPLDLAELWEEHLGEDQETMRNLNRPAGMDPFHQRDSIFEDVNDLIEEDEETVLQMIRSARRTDPLVEDDQF